MIYENQIKLFIKYSGDSDSWARSASKSEKDILTNEIWSKLEGYLNKIALIKTGKASAEFVATTEKSMKSEIENVDLIQKLYKLK